MDRVYCIRQGLTTESELTECSDMEFNARIGHREDGRAEKPSRRWRGNQESTPTPGLEGLDRGAV